MIMMCSESNFTIYDINIDFLEVLIRWPSVPKCMANVEMDGLKGYSLVLNKRYYVKKLNEIPNGTQFFLQYY